MPYLDDEFTYTRSFVGSAFGAMIDINGPYAGVIRHLNMPPSFVILDRVVWGVERAARQARGHRPLARHPRRVPPRRPADDRTRPSRRRVARYAQPSGRAANVANPVIMYSTVSSVSKTNRSAAGSPGRSVPST